jgi:hypothetical protein
MRELKDQIALLELRSEQLLIHIQQLPTNSVDQRAARQDLDKLLNRLAAVKQKRDRLVRELEEGALLTLPEDEVRSEERRERRGGRPNVP